MELVRSVSYPVRTQNPSAHNLAETRGYVELRAKEQEAQRLKYSPDQSDQQGVSGRRNHTALSGRDEPRTNVTSIYVQQQTTPPRKLEGIPQLPIGLSSSAFTAQQISQTPDSPSDHSEKSIHQEAASAYGDTLGLTSTILGFQGFRERLA